MESIDALKFLKSTDLETQVEREAFIYSLNLKESNRELTGKFKTGFSSKKITTFSGMQLPFHIIEPYMVAHDIKEIYTKLVGLDFTTLSLSHYGNLDISPDEPTNVLAAFSATQVSGTQYFVRFSIDFHQSQKEKFVIQGIGFGTDYSPLEKISQDELNDNDNPWTINHNFETDTGSVEFDDSDFYRVETPDQVSHDQDPFEECEVKGSTHYSGKTFGEVLEELDDDMSAYVAPRLITKRKIAQICAQEPFMDPIMLGCEQSSEGYFHLNTPCDVQVDYSLRLNNNGTKTVEYLIQIEQEDTYLFESQGMMLLNHKRTRIE